MVQFGFISHNLVLALIGVAMVFNHQRPITPAISPAPLSSISTTESDVRIGPDDFKVENALPNGYVKDGTVDYTTYIQFAVSQHRSLVFPSFPLLVNDKGLSIKSGTVIKFLKGSVLKLKPSMKGSYSIIKIKDASNVTLVNPVIIGDKDEHLGTQGEWGLGIKIEGGTNISIANPSITKCWGDGVYITGSNGRPSKDISISNANCTNNRRNGISIISVDGLNLESPYCSLNIGTRPNCGIDIEPNDSKDEIQNVKITNARTEKNLGTGISIGLNKLYGGKDKDVSIEILNHKDTGSGNGLLVSCTVGKSQRGEVVKGTINIVNATATLNQRLPLNMKGFRNSSLRVNIN